MWMKYLGIRTSLVTMAALLYSPVDSPKHQTCIRVMHVWYIGAINRWIKQRSLCLLPGWATPRLWAKQSRRNLWRHNLQAPNITFPCTYLPGIHQSSKTNIYSALLECCYNSALDRYWTVELHKLISTGSDRSTFPCIVRTLLYMQWPKITVTRNSSLSRRDRRTLPFGRCNRSKTLPPLYSVFLQHLLILSAKCYFFGAMGAHHDFFDYCAL